MLEVFSSLLHVHARLPTLVEVMNSMCHWFLRKVVPDLLQCGSKYPDCWWLFKLDMEVLCLQWVTRTFSQQLFLCFLSISVG